jgi:hypothetical protein
VAYQSSTQLFEGGTIISSGGYIHHIFTFGTTSFASVTPPIVTALPVTSGASTVGSTISTTNGTWDYSTTGGAPTFTYQWYRGSSAIAGATQVTYTIGAGDPGSFLYCNVLCTSGRGLRGFANSTPLIGPVTY